MEEKSSYLPHNSDHISETRPHLQLKDTEVLLWVFLGFTLQKEAAFTAVSAGRIDVASGGTKKNTDSFELGVIGQGQSTGG